LFTIATGDMQADCTTWTPNNSEKKDKVELQGKLLLKFDSCHCKGDQVLAILPDGGWKLAVESRDPDDVMHLDRSGHEHRPLYLVFLPAFLSLSLLA